MAKPPRITQSQGLRPPRLQKKRTPWRMFLGIFLAVAAWMLYTTITTPDLFLPGWSSALTYIAGGITGYVIGAMHALEGSLG